MVLYKCPRCGYSTDRKDNIRNHINKKKICKDSLSDVIPKEIEEEILSSPNKRTREDLLKEIEILKKENEALKSSVKVVNNTTNIGQQNNTIIVVNPYPRSNMDYLTDSDFKYCINRMIMSIPNLIKKIHFDPKHPENHNIFISNIKDSYAMTFDGSKWNLCDRQQLIEDLINKYEYKLEEWLDFGENAFPVEMKMFKEYLDKKEINGVVDRIKQEIKFMLYNDRNMITKNKN